MAAGRAAEGRAGHDRAGDGSTVWERRTGIGHAVKGRVGHGRVGNDIRAGDLVNAENGQFLFFIAPVLGLN